MKPCKAKSLVGGSTSTLIEGSLNRNFRQYGELKSSRVVKSAERRCKSQKVRRKTIHPREMLEKSRNAVFFQWFVCPVSRKVGLLKRRVRRYVLSREIKNCTPLWRNAHLEVKMTSCHFLKCRKIARRCGETHIHKSKCCLGALFEVLMSKNCTPLWREAHFEVKMYKTPRVRTTFWRSSDKKLHAAVARSTFTSQNVKKLTVSEHFLKFWCRKIARRCGAKHILKWKCTKYLCFGALFQVQMSKNQSVSKFVSQSISQVVN